MPLAIWICLLGIQIFAQDVVSAWLPTHIGDTWTYQREERDGSNGGGMVHPEIGRWREEETIKGSIAMPEGTLIRKQIHTIDPVPVEVRRHMPGIRDTRDDYELIRDGCVYSATDQIDQQRGQLRAEYRAALLSGSVPSEFCFPIKEGSTWGKVPSTSQAQEFVWRVVGVNADPFGVIAGTTFHLSTHAGSGEQVDRWFEPGIGILQEISEHHGTYEESRRQLLTAEIDGQPRNFQLKPARTIPLSDYDCDGPGWQHFARLNGTPFANRNACVAYLSRK